MKVTNLQQFEFLVDHMEKNVSFVRNFNKGITKINNKQEWTSLGEKLNSLGPPIRDGEGWQKVWIDLKGKVKKKIAHNKRESHATGGGIFNQKSLSPLEETVANIMFFHNMINPVGVVLGTPSNSTAAVTPPLVPTTLPVLIPDVVAANLPTTSSYTPATENVDDSFGVNTNAQKRRATTQAELLVEQIDIQRNSYTELRQSLKNIENFIKESERYNRKRYKLEEEMLKLAKEKFEWKKAQDKKKKY